MVKNYEKNLKVKSYEKLFSRIKFKLGVGKKERVERVISRRQRPHLMAGAKRPQPTGPQIAYGLESSAIAEAEYNYAVKILRLVFWNNTIRQGVIVNRVKGGEYLYFDVPYLVWKTFMEAPSKGRFFNNFIRDRFRFRRIN